MKELQSRIEENVTGATDAGYEELRREMIWNQLVRNGVIRFGGGLLREIKMKGRRKARSYVRANQQPIELLAKK